MGLDCGEYTIYLEFYVLMLYCAIIEMHWCIMHEYLLNKYLKRFSFSRSQVDTGPVISF